MNMNLSQIAEILGGSVCGDDISVTTLCSIESPIEGALSMIFSKKVLKTADISTLKALVVTNGLQDLVDIPCVVVPNGDQALLSLIDIFYPKPAVEYGVSSKSDIHTTAKVSEKAQIGAFVAVGTHSVIGDETVVGTNVSIGENVSIGSNCSIHPNVVIYDDCVIGDHVVIHSGSTIGTDGFGYVNTAQGHYKIRQVGNVVIEDHVEVGSNVCIDRATFASTVIGEGSKIDNLVQIAHNVQIGKHSIVVAQAGIAGSTTIGNFVIVGGQSAIVDHVNIADGVILGGRTGVMGDIKDKGVYFGTPPQPHREFMRNSAVAKDLYKMKKQLDTLMEKKDD